MIHAYDQLYLDKAQVSLTQMMRYAVQDLGYDPFHEADIMRFVEAIQKALKACE